jgi:hypothetical protein
MFLVKYTHDTFKASSPLTRQEYDMLVSMRPNLFMDHFGSFLLIMVWIQPSDCVLPKKNLERYPSSPLSVIHDGWSSQRLLGFIIENICMVPDHLNFDCVNSMWNVIVLRKFYKGSLNNIWYHTTPCMKGRWHACFCDT